MAKARVRYKGFSDVRKISADDLRPLGISITADLVFSRENNFAMNIDLNQELEDVLRNEGTFTIEEITDENQIGDEVVTATIGDDTQAAADALNVAAGLIEPDEDDGDDTDNDEE